MNRSQLMLVFLIVSAVALASPSPELSNLPGCVVHAAEPSACGDVFSMVATIKPFVELEMIDGELCFGTWVHVTVDEKPRVLAEEKKSHGESTYFHITPEGWIRVHVQQGEVVGPNQHGQRNHWYLSADYSTDPPTVKLVADPDKYSHWLFVDKVPETSRTTKREDRFAKYSCQIKHQNPQGDHLWLYWSDEVKKVLSPNEKRLISMRKPRLSSEAKVTFVVSKLGGPIEGK